MVGDMGEWKRNGICHLGGGGLRVGDSVLSVQGSGFRVEGLGSTWGHLFISLVVYPRTYSTNKLGAKYHPVMFSFGATAIGAKFANTKKSTVEYVVLHGSSSESPSGLKIETTRV